MGPLASVVAAGALALTPALAWGAAASASPQAALNRIVASAPGTTGVSVMCGNSARAVEAGASTPVRAASTLKLAIAFAAAISQRASASTVSTGPTFTAAIEQSDNSAANELLRLAGGGSVATGTRGVNALMARLGMASTRLDGPYRDGPGRSQKVTTAHDLRLLAQATQQLATYGTGPLADAGATQGQAKALIAHMARSSHQGLIAPAVRRGGTVAHKPGWLDDVENDLAIVILPGARPCAVGIVSEGLSLGSAQSIGQQVVDKVLVPMTAARTAPRATSSVPDSAGTASSPGPATTATATATTDSAGNGASAQTTPREVVLTTVPATPSGSPWFTNWRWLAVAAIALLLALVVLRQAQVSRRQRRRRRPRGEG